MEKWISDRCVCAPQHRSAGTSIAPTDPSPDVYRGHRCRSGSAESGEYLLLSLLSLLVFGLPHPSIPAGGNAIAGSGVAVLAGGRLGELVQLREVHDDRIGTRTGTAQTVG